MEEMLNFAATNLKMLNLMLNLNLKMLNFAATNLKMLHLNLMLNLTLKMLNFAATNFKKSVRIVSKDFFQNFVVRS